MRTAKALSIDGSAVGVRNNRWKQQTFAERFWSRVDRCGPDECWLWTGCLNRKGYGSAAISTGRTELTHRVANVLANGPLPEGVLVLHKPECRYRACCNPAHHYRGNQKQNVADATAAGRQFFKNGGCRGERHAAAVLTADIVREARRLYVSGVNGGELARRFGVKYSTLQKAVTRSTWGHVQ